MTDWLQNPLGMADQTTQYVETPAFANGTFDGTEVSAQGVRLIASNAFPQRGTWTSLEVGVAESSAGETNELPQGMTELLPSWNVQADANTGISFFVRCRVSGAWSDWLYIGAWGRVGPQGKQSLTFEHGQVDVDVLELQTAADAWQIQARFWAFETAAISPTLQRLWVIASGPQDADGFESRPPEDSTANDSSNAWARDLDLDFRTQADEAPALKPRVCSPTSVSMVLAYRGVDRPTAENALAIYDADSGLFGNWNRAVAYAGSQGRVARLVRIRSWDEVKAFIAAGQPLIASIRFEEDEFPSNVMRRTNGHLIVIRGLTADGDAIVNDPASRDRGDGVVYVQQELARAWIAKGGVAYVIK